MTLSRLASDIADRAIHAHCEHGAKSAIGEALFNALGFHRVDKRRRPRRPNWRARDRFLAPYEKRFGKMVRAIWDDERRVVLANMRKYPLKGMGGAARKDSPSPVDNWLYPSTRYAAKLSKASQGVLASLLEASITQVIDIGGYDVAFDVVNEHALDWLRDYTPKLSANLEAVNTEDLTRTLREGLKAGESMDDLKRRVNDVFDEYDSVRAERIARSETIRSQEQGNLAVYREAGFSRKVWLANPDACEEVCAPLDNVDIPIDEPFDFDDKGYGDRMGPPAHPNCRCASAPFESEWAD